jgi:hypothetical protein
MPQNRQNLIVIIATTAAMVILAGVIGVTAYQLGQRSRPEIAATFTVTPTTVPPKIITNTSTATATASPTGTVTATPTASPTSTPTPTPTPIVVITHIKELGKLETTEYAMRTVIDLGNEPDGWWQKLVGSDQVMLVAEGEVVAGFDLTKISPDDIAVQGNQVAITLPAPEILYSRIDNERTQVYERKTGLFVTPDKGLESRARQTAETALLDWATQRGIFAKAEQAGRAQIESLLHSLGFTEVTITVKKREL